MSGVNDKPSQEELEAAMKKGSQRLKRLLELEKEFHGDRNLAWKLLENEEKSDFRPWKVGKNEEK